MLESYHQHTQYLFSQVQPMVDGPEKRHEWTPEEDNPRIHRYKMAGTEESIEERKGVLHLVHAWSQRAQPEKVFFPLLLLFFLINRCLILLY